MGEEVERELQLDERVAGELDLATGQGPCGVEVPRLDGDEAAGPVAHQPQHPTDVLGPVLQGPDGVEGLGQ